MVPVGGSDFQNGGRGLVPVGGHRRVPVGGPGRFSNTRGQFRGRLPRPIPARFLRAAAAEADGPGPDEVNESPVPSQISISRRKPHQCGVRIDIYSLCRNITCNILFYFQNNVCMPDEQCVRVGFASTACVPRIRPSSLL
jgi:hypothetical protein